MPKYLLYLLAICVVFSCAEESTITFTEQTITTETNKIVEINIPIAQGNELVRDQINKALDTEIISNLTFETNSSKTTPSVAQSIDKFNGEYTAFKTEFPDTPMEWEAQIDGEVMYQSDAIISIAMTSYLNTGGAHGNLIISFLNFDAISGQQLKTKQLFNDFDAFKTRVEAYFNNHIADKKELYFEPDNFILPKNIGFNETGVILLYNSYEIAPYTTGLTEFTIPFEELMPYLNVM